MNLVILQQYCGILGYELTPSEQEVHRILRPVPSQKRIARKHHISSPDILGISAMAAADTWQCFQKKQQTIGSNSGSVFNCTSLLHPETNHRKLELDS